MGAGTESGEPEPGGLGVVGETNIGDAGWRREMNDSKKRGDCKRIWLSSGKGTVTTLLMEG